MSRSRLLPRSLLAPLALAGAVAGSAACSKQAADTGVGREPVMKTATEAAAVFDDAEQELGAALRGKAAPPPTGADAFEAPEPLPAQPSPPDPRPASESPQPETRLAAESPCTKACRALASMRRAADRLCELTGEGDERCQDVRDRVKVARKRVQSRCPACGE